MAISTPELDVGIAETFRQSEASLVQVTLRLTPPRYKPASLCSQMQLPQSILHLLS